MTPKISVEQRRARLIARHHLGQPAESATSAVSAMIVLHATDPVTVYLSAWARTRMASADELDEAIYARREVIRMLGMRRTMFLVPAPLVPVVQRACTDDVARRMRQGLERDLEKGGVGDGDAAAWLRDVGEGVLRALTARGSGFAADLSAQEPRLRTALEYAPGKSYGGTANITSRVLMLLSAEGLIVRGDRRGGWSSGQFKWFPAQSWMPEPRDFAGSVGAAAAGGDPAGLLGSTLTAAAARAELARRWLLAFGPAPAADLQWWAGWTAGQAKAALAALPVTEVDLDGRPGVALATDTEPLPARSSSAAPGAVLLPALDPTPMGWQSREWFLGEHGPALFDRTGNIGPSIWWDGRIVGGWAQRATGEVVFRLLEDVGADAATAVEAEAARLRAWLGDARVTPRFRTPLERELVA
jgi:hypothetical protein